MLRFFFTLLFVFLAVNCSELHFSSWNCVEEGGRECESYGDTKWLFKNPVDILITLDGTSSLRKLNPHVTAHFNQFLKCMEPLNWKIGLLSSAQDKSKDSRFGGLLRLEEGGLASSKKTLTQYKNNYFKVFNDSISLESGCALPPYCGKGPFQPLESLNVFMEEKSSSFLRKNTPLVYIMVSSKHQQKKSMFSKKPVKGENVLSFFDQKNKKDSREFMSLAVLPPAGPDECVKTFGGQLARGTRGLANAGQVYGLITANPGILLSSVLIGQASQGRGISPKEREIAHFAQQSGGHTLNLCSPDFGKAMAYTLFQHLKIEDKFPEECRTVHKH